MQYRLRRTITEIEREPLSVFSPLLAQLLFHRGIKDSAEARNFLDPDYDLGTHDPFLLADAERAARRIIAAIKSNREAESASKIGGEMIAIYADYDADGIPGAAALSDFFRRIGFTNFFVYIPHRHNEGFGVNADAVREIARRGTKLMITIDCGITDAPALSIAKENGIEVIVTDHHEPPQELPPAYAVIDPKRHDCSYPDKKICGAGVIFKLIQAILKIDRLGLSEGHEKWLLDLVGLATLSDMVPLVGENRIFAKYGLHVLRRTQRKGLIQLFSRLRMDQRHLTEDDVAFMITPRINAASRMGLPMDAYELLTADTDDKAYAAAEHLDHINNERKSAVAVLVKEVKKAVRNRHPIDMPDVLVFGNPEWRPALLGLAANSCVEEFGRPVFLWGRDGDNMIKGSCRGDGDAHIVEIMRHVPSGVFTQFGGHRHSGGFTVSDEAVHYLDKHLNEAAQKISQSKKVVGDGKSDENISSGNSVDKNIGDKNPDDENMIDAELSLSDINGHLFDEISKLAPFGVGNRKPLFLFRKVTPKSVRLFGKTKEHIEIVFDRVNAIGFFGAAENWGKRLLEHYSAHDANTRDANAPLTVDLIASLEKSVFRGRPELRLRVHDLVEYTSNQNI